MDFTLFLYVLFIMDFSQAHRAAFLPAVSGIVGKGLEREIMRPFLCLRRFGAHSETPFSSPFFRRTAFFPAVSGMVGKGLERETLLPFPRLRRFGTHCETGSKFLLLFIIKKNTTFSVSSYKSSNCRYILIFQGLSAFRISQSYRRTRVKPCISSLSFVVHFVVNHAIILLISRFAPISDE